MKNMYKNVLFHKACHFIHII